MKRISFILFAILTSFNIALAQDPVTSVTVERDPGSDQLPSLTPISLINRGLNGNPYQWVIYTAAIGGGYGVRPNAFEVWEYPPSIVNPSCCIQRFSIDKSNGGAQPFNIDKNGGLALGGYGDAGNAFLAVNGNVGIGTTDTKGYNLAVNGSVIATSMTVKLYSAWPDYVFKPTYHLPSLTDVKSYIDQNHHLPDMPSGQEVAKDGINLGEMNKLLTKKVEELTLYLIEKDKQDKKREVQLISQQQQINQLKQALKIKPNFKHK